MNRFLRTINIDDCKILIPIETITEVILYDKVEDDCNYIILIFVKGESTAAGREEYENVDIARLRFDKIERELNN